MLEVQCQHFNHAVKSTLHGCIIKNKQMSKIGSKTEKLSCHQCICSGAKKNGTLSYNHEGRATPPVSFQRQLPSTITRLYSIQRRSSVYRLHPTGRASPHPSQTESGVGSYQTSPPRQ